jgi:hypothetical protein
MTDFSREILLGQLLAFLEPVIAQPQKPTVVPKFVRRAQSWRDIFPRRSGKQLVPFTPFGHGFERKVLIELPSAIRGSEDLVLVRAGSVATLGARIAVAVIAFSVEQVDVSVAALGQMERGGKAENSSSDNYYL